MPHAHRVALLLACHLPMLTCCKADVIVVVDIGAGNVISRVVLGCHECATRPSRGRHASAREGVVSLMCWNAVETARALGSVVRADVGTLVPLVLRRGDRPGGACVVNTRDLRGLGSGPGVLQGR